MIVRYAHLWLWLCVFGSRCVCMWVYAFVCVFVYIYVCILICLCVFGVSVCLFACGCFRGSLDEDENRRPSGIQLGGFWGYEQPHTQ